MPGRYPRFLGGAFGEGFGLRHDVFDLYVLIATKLAALISSFSLRMKRLINFLPP